MTRLAIAIDLSRCTGCNTCAMACKMQNNVPMGMTWNRVLNENCEFEVGVQGTYPSISRSHLPIACQHCENPACLRVCPTGATYKDDKGRVEIDYEKCIGCGICAQKCPRKLITVDGKVPEVKPAAPKAAPAAAVKPAAPTAEKPAAEAAAAPKAEAPAEPKE